MPSVLPDQGIKVFALRVKASLFGHNAPKKMKVSEGVGHRHRRLADHRTGWCQTGRMTPSPHEEEETIYLDGRQESILPGSWIVVETPETERLTKQKTHILRAGRPTVAHPAPSTA